MKILGIDPGTRNCGYAIIEKIGNKKTLVEAGLIKIKQDDCSLYNTALFLLCLFLIKHITWQASTKLSFLCAYCRQVGKEKKRQRCHMVLISTENDRGNESRKAPLGACYHELLEVWT